jgi:SAM-dependent methyltransferase
MKVGEHVCPLAKIAWEEGMAMSRETADPAADRQRSPCRDHYEQFLARHYTWMFGVPYADKVAEQRRLLEASGALPARRRLAIDLGAGSGFQSMALADLGFARVVAVDLSPTLLAELEHRKEARPVETVEADANAYLAGVTRGAADMILCMGDTLSHLASRADVARLFAAASAALADGGAFVVTYRDLSTELTGADRFIPVAGDADRIFTCFLDYRADTVLVHDLLHERHGGQWRLRASAYPKLRLPVSWVEAELRAAGFGDVAQLPALRLVGLVARNA